MQVGTGIVDRSLEDALRRDHLATVFVGFTDRHSELQQLVGRALEVVVDAVFDGVQHGHVGGLGLNRCVGVGGADQSEHKGVQCRGAGGLIARHETLPQREPQACAQRQHDGAGRTHRQRVAGDELLQPIGAAVGAGAHRLAVEVALQIVGQCGRTVVALLGLALERRGHDRIQIALERAGTRLVAGDGARHAQIAGEDLGFQRPRLLRSVQPRTGEQLGQHHPQRIHIRRHRDRQRQHLLGCGVGERHRTSCQPCQRRRFDGSGLTFDQFGDAEVEQLRRTVGRHQHVGGFEIAVDHQLAVGVGHGAHHLHHQPQHVLELTALAVRIDRHAIDVLERQIGPAAVGQPGIEQHCDVRMLQPRQDRPLARQALA